MSAAELEALHREASTCARCPQLAATRTAVVVGTGPPGADLLFVTAAPGRADDEAGEPLTGAPARLLDDLLDGIGMALSDVFVAPAIKCRPPANRDALPQEAANCSGYLLRQIDLVEPKVVCTLGNTATRLLRGAPESVTRLHGRAEVRAFGSLAVRLLPLYHPAAALYTTRLQDELRADFARIPALLAMDTPRAPAPPPAVEPEPMLPPEEPLDEEQMGLF